MKKLSKNHFSVPPSGVRGLFPPLEGLGEVKTTTMKNILLLATTLFSIFTFAQADPIINIPDANFKAKLLQASSSNPIASTESPNSGGSVSVYHKIDTNNDGNIQVSEALSIKWLDVKNIVINSYCIQSLEGILSFTNLIYLHCYGNQLTSLDLQGLTNLRFLYCRQNHLTSLRERLKTKNIKKIKKNCLIN
jgi:hypothetical protein